MTKGTTGTTQIHLSTSSEGHYIHDSQLSCVFVDILCIHKDYVYRLTFHK